MRVRAFFEQARQRPLAIWVLLAYLAIKFLGLIDSAVSWQQQIFDGVTINGPASLAIYTANAVLFMTLLVGLSLVTLWNRTKTGLVLACLIVLLYFYRSLLLDLFGGSVTSYLDETGEESTAFFHVYGHRLHQLLQVILASVPIWSRAARKFVGWRT